MNQAFSLAFSLLVLPLLQILLWLFPLMLCGIGVRFLKHRIDDILLFDLGRPVYYAFAAVGTPVHEGFHLLACLLFGHRIVRFNLFFPDPSGRLGYVEHAFDPKNLYQRIGGFFIAVAPLIGGVSVIYGITRIFFPEWLTVISLPDGPLLLYDRTGWHFSEVFKTLGFAFYSGILHLAVHPPALHAYTPLYFLMVAAVGSHLFPSTDDFRGGLPGLIVLYIFIVLAYGTAVLFDLSLNHAAVHAAAVVRDIFALMAQIILVLFAVYLGLLAVRTILGVFRR